MHEHPELPLNHLYEALAGLPVTLRSLSFAEVIEGGVPQDINVLINAGKAGDAWSGGDVWLDTRLRGAVSRFVADGGALLGVGEPSATGSGFHYFQTADMLGVDRETGQTVCFTKYRHHVREPHFITADLLDKPYFHNAVPDVYALDGDTQVLCADQGQVQVAVKEYGKGRGVYFNGFTYSPDNARLLYRALLWAVRKEQGIEYFLPDNPACECAWFPGSRMLVLINNTEAMQTVSIQTLQGTITSVVEPAGINVFHELDADNILKLNMICE